VALLNSYQSGFPQKISSPFMVSQKKRLGKAATGAIPITIQLEPELNETHGEELFSSAASLLPQMRERGRSLYFSMRIDR